jgi:hypothetical protein
MALTRDFKETILARARRDARVRQALGTEAINAYLAGDTTAGKAILRDLVNATVSIEGLAVAVNKRAHGCASFAPPLALEQARGAAGGCWVDDKFVGIDPPSNLTPRPPSLRGKGGMRANA